MGTNKYILSLDQGTTSCRAIIFDLDGHKIGIAQKEFKQYYPQQGWVEHDAIEIWEKQLAVIKEVLLDNNLDANKISAIGITNQRETTVIWDKSTGEPIHKAIVWQDRRTSQYCDELKAQGLLPMIKEKTGLLIDAYFSGTKIKYILDHVDGARAKAEAGQLAFGTMDSWLIYKLTNGLHHKTDVTNASRTMLFNIHTLSWDYDILDLLDVPVQILPEVIDSDGHFGHTDANLVGNKIAITGVAGDQHAALFGQLCTEEGMGKNTYGTGCFLMINTGNRVVESNNKLLSTIAWKIKGKVQYALEGSVFIGGAVIQWLRDGLKLIDSAKDSEQMALSVEDSGGVIFVPALTGLGAPHWDQYARGAILGITRGTRDAHIVRAAIESIALQVMDLVEAIQKDLGTDLKDLRVDGGAANNDFLMQLQSDLLDTVVLRPTELETTALGVAYIAGLGAGLYKSIEDLQSIWQKDKVFSPTNKSYDLLKKQWAEGIKRSKNWAIDE